MIDHEHNNIDSAYGFLFPIAINYYYYYIIVVVILVINIIYIILIIVMISIIKD
jgi:hypothetical protein